MAILFNFLRVLQGQITLPWDCFAALRVFSIFTSCAAGSFSFGAEPRGINLFSNLYVVENSFMFLGLLLLDLPSTKGDDPFLLLQPSQQVGGCRDVLPCPAPSQGVVFPGISSFLLYFPTLNPFHLIGFGDFFDDIPSVKWWRKIISCFCWFVPPQLQHRLFCSSTYSDHRVCFWRAIVELLPCFLRPIISYWIKFSTWHLLLLISN